MKTRYLIAISLLVISLAALWSATANRLPWQKAAPMSSAEVASIPLGQVSAEKYGKMGFPGGKISYVDVNGPHWAVGTENGEVLLISNHGKTIWKRSLGIGKITALQVSNDEKVIYVAEQSPDGNTYSLDAATGKINWKFSAAQNALGSDPSGRSLPSIPWLKEDKNGNLFIAAYRMGRTEKTRRAYFSKIYALKPDGSLIWQFPKEGTMDAWVNYAAVSPEASGVLIFSTSTYELPPDAKYPHTMYWLDKQTSKTSKTLDIPSAEKNRRTVVRSSPTMSDDGKHAAFITSDGRAFYFTADGQALWERALSKETQIGASTVGAIGRTAHMTKDKVIFTTINTFNRANWILPSPVEHPSSNSLFIFNQKGELLHKISFGGNVEDASFAEDYGAFAIGRNIHSKNYSVHGMKIINTETGETLLSFPTHGPCQATALSPDGKYAAVIEAPASLEDGKIIGSYTLHIIKTK